MSRSNDNESSALVGTIQSIMEHLGPRHHDRTGLDYFTGYGETLYDWELFFDGIALAYFDSLRYTVNGIRIFLGEQEKSGFIRRNSRGTAADAQSAWEPFEREELCKPFLCQLALMVSRLYGDVSWLGSDAFDGLSRYLRHWLSTWDRDESGLSEWASGPHSGADTQLERVGPWRSRYCEGTDLNAFLYRECLAAGRLARDLGLPDEAEEFTRQAEIKKERMRELLWDPDDGFFYDRDIRTGCQIRVKSAAAFLTLWAGVATVAQAAELVERHLWNSEEFWTPYPVASYARSEPSYTQHYQPPPGSDLTFALGPGHANWCGGMWPHWNYLIAHGLADYGYREEAQHIADQFYAAVAADPMMYEWYNAETGRGHGLHPFCGGATVLGAFLPSELALGFDPLRIASVDDPLDLTAMRQRLGIHHPFTPAPHRMVHAASSAERR